MAHMRQRGKAAHSEVHCSGSSLSPGRCFGVVGTAFIPSDCTEFGRVCIRQALWGRVTRGSVLPRDVLAFWGAPTACPRWLGCSPALRHHCPDTGTVARPLLDKITVQVTFGCGHILCFMVCPTIDWLVSMLFRWGVSSITAAFLGLCGPAASRIGPLWGSYKQYFYCT